MVKKNYTMKKTISVKQFIIEFGEGFSKHMKDRLLELGTRCILTRQENNHTLELKHLEHNKYDDGELLQKEFAYGQIVMNEGLLYFSDRISENTDIMPALVVKDIYLAINSDEMTFDEGIKAKKIDDSNIDFVIDNLLKVCPEVSKEHLAILSKYTK